MDLKSRIERKRTMARAILYGAGALVFVIVAVSTYALLSVDWATGSIHGFVTFFPIQFLALLIVYFIAFMLIMSMTRTAYGITNPPRMTFAKAFCVECDNFVKDNNRRWLYLLVALLITHCIVVENPGPGPIVEGIVNAPSAIFSQSTRDAADARTNYLLYGNPDPKNPSLWPKDAVAASVEKAETKVAVQTAWDRFATARFWREARFYLFILTFFYFFVAFSDEVIIGIKGLIRETNGFIQKHKAEKKPEDPKASATVTPAPATKQASTVSATTPAGTATATVPPGSTPGATATVTVAAPTQQPKEKTEFGVIFLASLLAEILPKIIHEIVDHRDERRKGVHA